MSSTYLRIKKSEEKKIKEISKILNKQRLDNDLDVLKESEIFHILIELAFQRMKIENGEIEIE